MSLKLKIKAVDYHRNGVSGDGFHVVTFRHGKADMVGILFGDKQCAVLDVAKLAAGDIEAHGENCFRGDEFEPELRAAVDADWDRRHPESAAEPQTLKLAR